MFKRASSCQRASTAYDPFTRCNDLRHFQITFALVFYVRIDSRCIANESYRSERSIIGISPRFQEYYSCERCSIRNSRYFGIGFLQPGKLSITCGRYGVFFAGSSLENTFPKLHATSLLSLVPFSRRSIFCRNVEIVRHSSFLCCFFRITSVSCYFQGVCLYRGLQSVARFPRRSRLRRFTLGRFYQPEHVS